MVDRRDYQTINLDTLENNSIESVYDKECPYCGKDLHIDFWIGSWNCDYCKINFWKIYSVRKKE